jgi:hypothetical protein
MARFVLVHADDQVQANLIVAPPVARLPAAVAPQFLHNCCAPDVGAPRTEELVALDRFAR